jgi:hypothetical protein
LYLYSTGSAIQELQGKLRECSSFLEDDFDDFSKIPGSRRKLQEGFLKAN